MADQLRAQGMPEDAIAQMTAMVGETEGSRPKSADNKSKRESHDAEVDVDKWLNLDGVEYFMRILTSDDATMEFFSQMPGYTYQYARYSDWITQFIRALSKRDEVDPKAMNRDQKAALKGLKSCNSRF